jgi:hypothetical protein
MRIKGADMTVGDAGIPFTITIDEDLTGYATTEIQLIFVSPTGDTFRKTPYSITATAGGGTTIVYYSYSTDILEDGDWHLYLYNVRTGFEYNEGNNVFVVRKKAEDMASE